MNRLDHTVNHAWHVAINAANTEMATWKAWMYHGKQIADEVPRLIALFAHERTNALATAQRQCAQSPLEPIPDNHLTCCLGVACRTCDALLALEKAELTPGQIDEAKAWTCAAHILTECGAHPKQYDTSAGFVITIGDRMYWDRVYKSLAAADYGD